MAIGKDNTLLWHLRDDLMRFKKLTIGHPCIMGRKTWESIPEKFRPLPGRTNVILTRDKSYSAKGALVTDSIEDAIDKAKNAHGGDEIFIIGGAQIYKEAMPLADRLYVTEVDTDIDGDAFFPEYANLFTKEISREEGFDEKTGLKYAWVDLEKA